MDGIDGINANIRALRDRLLAAAADAADESAHLLESYAKANAPWTDRTTHLRNSLDGTWEVNLSTATVMISFSKEYGPFLDPGHFAKRNTTRWSTRKGKTTVQRISDHAFGSWVSYPILWPTVAHNAHRVTGIFARHMRI